MDQTKEENLHFCLLKIEFDFIEKCNFVAKKSEKCQNHPSAGRFTCIKTSKDHFFNTTAYLCNELGMFDVKSIGKCCKSCFLSLYHIECHKTIKLMFFSTFTGFWGENRQILEFLVKNR